MADSSEEGNRLRSIRRTWYCLTREKTDSFVTESLPPAHQLQASVCTLCFIYLKKVQFLQNLSQSSAALIHHR